MNKSAKTTLGISIVLGVIGGAYWLWRSVKKDMKTLNEREKKNHESLRQAGYTENEIQNPKTDETGENNIINMPKDLFNEIRISNDFEYDVLFPGQIFGRKAEEHVVHVMQRFDKKSQRTYLDFLFTIPKSALPYRGTRLVKDALTQTGDFVKAIRGEWNRDTESLEGDNRFALTMEKIMLDELAAANIKVDKKSKLVIDTGIEGYALIWVNTENDEQIRDLTKITKNIYDPENDGIRVTDYVSETAEILEEAEDKLDRDEKLTEDDRVILQTSNEKLTAEVAAVFAAVRVSIPLQDNKHLAGLTKRGAYRILREIYDELEIEGQRDKVFKYEYFLFHNPEYAVEVYQEEELENGRYCVKMIEVDDLE